MAKIAGIAATPTDTAKPIKIKVAAKNTDPNIAPTIYSGYNIYNKAAEI